MVTLPLHATLVRVACAVEVVVVLGATVDVLLAPTVFVIDGTTLAVRVTLGCEVPVMLGATVEVPTVELGSTVTVRVDVPVMVGTTVTVRVEEGTTVLVPQPIGT